MNAILEVQGLRKQYKDSAFCLNDVSFSIPSGAIMGFVGENGAGKSTTIGCILNILIKDGGSVKIFGQEMTDGSTGLRDDIGVVYDTNAFPPHLTPLKISSAMRHMYSKWDEPLFKEYLRKFKLPEKQTVKSFSRGMTMKLGVAAALSRHPKLLVLDEATSGLDPIARDDILDVFLDFVQDENNSILLSSHITSDLEKVADYITFIHDGKILFSQKKDDLIDKYGVMRCKAAQFAQVGKEDMLAYRKHDYHTVRGAVVSDGLYQVGETQHAGGILCLPVPFGWHGQRLIHGGQRMGMDERFYIGAKHGHNRNRVYRVPVRHKADVC